MFKYSSIIIGILGLSVVYQGITGRTQGQLILDQRKDFNQEVATQTLIQLTEGKADHTRPLISDEDLARLVDHLEALPEPRLVRWPDGHQELISEGHKALRIFTQGRRTFVDITDDNSFDLPLHPNIPLKLDEHPPLLNNPSFPLSIRFGKEKLAHLTDLILPSRMKDRLTQFTSFETRYCFFFDMHRYYRSLTGRKSQAWLLNEIRTLVSKSSSNVTVREFAHKWGQNTIIARFEPVEGRSETRGGEKGKTLIVAAPGADDDGSGTVTILEALDVLLQHNWRPSPGSGAVEFMWFSAEEGGLLGSQEVARAYRQNNTPVSAMLQLDMTAFVKNATVVIRRNTESLCTKYLRLLIDEYLAIGWTNTKCGYACSDHASWTNINVPSAFAIESRFEDSNQMIHSAGDTIHQPGFNFNHMAEFSKLVLGINWERKKEYLDRLVWGYAVRVKDVCACLK
ncbi:hypothetical protein VP01_196g2 [Puccinia sorghi]|uniref:Peptide hydrolase n=1 Tax=Puccinia sorghi TaxID=27349 RepID=A0A0L6VBV9_9BASI|nr:hypothetical protein VP01_196g2 [Puccinia sorghi]